MSKKNCKVTSREMGDEGEQIATDFLKRKGYKIIDRNFWCRQGEIDIIAKKEDEYVFCEVKTRKNLKYGEPRDSVNEIKRKHILDATRYYLYKNDLYDKYIRFDVIEVYIYKNKNYINHIKNANFNMK